MTGRSEQNRIMAADHVAAVVRHQAAVRLVVLAAPVEGVDLEAEACRQRLANSM